MSNDPELVLMDLTKQWPNGTTALSQISLEIAGGTTLALLGPSGSGKTTLLRVIAGLDQPDQGSILRRGQSVNVLPPSKRDVAVQFQRPAIYPHLTVRENLCFGEKLRHKRSLISKLFYPRSNDNPLLDEVAKTLKIEKLLSHRPDQLSGGQQQRVAYGRALLRNASLLLLDEPLCQVEARLRQEIWSQLAGLNELNKSARLLVTHDPTEALRVADRIAVISQGRLLQIGPSERVVARPNSLEVAEMLHGEELTLLKGQLTSYNEKLMLAIGEHSFPVPPEIGRSLTKEQWVTLGMPRGTVRPTTEKAGVGMLAGTVQFVEPVQSRLCQVVVKSHSTLVRLIVAMPPILQPGLEVCFRFDLQQALWFDGVSGAALVP